MSLSRMNIVLTRLDVSDDASALEQDNDYMGTDAQRQEQLVKNFSRELLRVLPRHLRTCVVSQITDARLLEVWNRFVRGDHLCNMIREVISGIADGSRPGIPVALADRGEVEEYSGEAATAKKPAKDENTTTFKFSDFVHLDGE